MKFETFPSIVLSLWQTVMHREGKRKEEFERMMEGTNRYCRESFARSPELESVTPIEKLRRALGDDANAYVSGVHHQLAEAELNKDRDRMRELEKERARYREGFPNWRWGKCVKDYVRSRWIQRKRKTYHSCETNRGIDSNMSVLNTLPERAKILILGDWGTGKRDAEEVLRLGTDKDLNPDLVIHVGDIYYSGEVDECRENFLYVIRRRVGFSKPVYTLAGNHDYYASGAGYHHILRVLNTGVHRQAASYFCLRNEYWQLLAMDTGFNAARPIGAHCTSLRDDEIKWHQEKLDNSGDRSTILFSHHQLFSPFEKIGDPNNGDSINLNLLDVFSPYFDQIRGWFWGHEHDFVHGERGFQGLPAGFCLGHGAIPVAVAGHKRTRHRRGIYNGLAYPQMRLGNNGSDFNRGFSILRLNAADAEVDHYEVKSGTTRLLGTVKL